MQAILFHVFSLGTPAVELRGLRSPSFLMAHFYRLKTWRFILWNWGGKGGKGTSFLGCRRMKMGLRKGIEPKGPREKPARLQGMISALSWKIQMRFFCPGIGSP